MKWSLRSIEIADVAMLLDWYNDEKLHRTANTRTFKPYKYEELVDYWKEKLSRRNAFYYAILLENELVGRAGIKLKKNDEEFYADYSILIGVPSLYSKGLGTEITKHIITETFNNFDISAIYLEVRADNKRAIRCYEKAGFQINKVLVKDNVEMFEMKIDRI